MCGRHRCRRPISIQKRRACGPHGIGRRRARAAATTDTAEDDVDDLALSTLLPAAIRIVATCGAQHLGDAAFEAVAKPLLVAAQAETQISHRITWATKMFDGRRRVTV